MSLDHAEFRFQDGTVFHGCYNGTSDTMCGAMFTTRDAAAEHWGQLAPSECGHEGEECIAVSYYGGGFWWYGKACRQCMIFLGPIDPCRTEHHDFMPEWACHPKS